MSSISTLFFGRKYLYYFNFTTTCYLFFEKETVAEDSGGFRLLALSSLLCLPSSTFITTAVTFFFLCDTERARVISFILDVILWKN